MSFFHSCRAFEIKGSSALKLPVLSDRPIWVLKATEDH